MDGFTGRSYMSRNEFPLCTLGDLRSFPYVLGKKKIYVRIKFRDSRRPTFTVYPLGEDFVYLGTTQKSRFRLSSG